MESDSISGSEMRQCALTWVAGIFSELTVAAQTHGENPGLRVDPVPLCSWIPSVLPVRSGELVLWSPFMETVTVTSSSPQLQFRSRLLNPCLVTVGECCSCGLFTSPGPLLGCPSFVSETTALCLCKPPSEPLSPI